jgi:hydrogenase expression/formation protein HypC
MCLAVPAKIVNINEDTALVEISGNFRNTNVSLIENPQIGEYVLIHAGFAIERVDAETAQEINEMEGIG